MLHINQAIVVEGKYDKIKLSSLTDAVIIVTNGFSIFKDKEKCALIRHYAEKTGIIILTDSDSAGFKIRGYIKSITNSGNIKNVYIPDIFGKEKRKEKPSREGKLGVEGVDADVLREAFAKAGLICDADYKPKTEFITRMDLYSDGLTGGQNSSAKRKALLKRLELPELMTTSALLEVLNSMLEVAQYREIIDDINKEYT